MIELGPLKAQMRAVVDHWERLEAELGQTLLLEGGYTRTQLASDLADLESGVIEVVEGVSEQERMAQQRDALKTKLLGRFDQVKDKLTAQFKSTRHAAAVPRKPLPTATAEKFLKPLDDISEIWKTLNADTSILPTLRPMTIARGYTQENFATDLAALKATYAAVGTAARETRQRRAARSTPLAGLAKRITQYRALAKSELEPNEPLYATIP